jgi:predicted kinase
MPNLYVLVGLPGSGKSTLVSSLKKDNPNSFVYSSDLYIEENAKSNNLTYNQAFNQFINDAIKYMNIQLEKAIEQSQDIIWDQTNLTVKKRKSILSRFGKKYKKICICIESPKTIQEQTELEKRLNSREGKTIPYSVIKDMSNRYEPPSFDEMFDEISIINLFEVKKD